MKTINSLNYFREGTIQSNTIHEKPAILFITVWRLSLLNDVIIYQEILFRCTYGFKKILNLPKAFLVGSLSFQRLKIFVLRFDLFNIRTEHISTTGFFIKGDPAFFVPSINSGSRNIQFVGCGFNWNVFVFQ